MPHGPHSVPAITRFLGAAAVFAIALLVSGVVPGVAAPGAVTQYKSVPSEPLIEGPSIDEEIAQQSALYAWLMQETPEAVLADPTIVGLTDTERGDMKKAQDEEIGRAIVGRAKALGLKVHFSGLDAALLSDAPRRVAGGYLRAMPDGGFVWAAAIRAEDAGALRVHIGGLDLPPDADLYFYSPDGQAFGPYSGRGPLGAAGVRLPRAGGAAARDAELEVGLEVGGDVVAAEAVVRRQEVRDLAGADAVVQQSAGAGVDVLPGDPLHQGHRALRRVRRRDVVARRVFDAGDIERAE